MQNVFNHFFNDYDDWYDTPMGKFVDQVETDALFKLLQPYPNESILEVGCGTGNFVLKLAQRQCQISGVDIAPNMLQQAQNKLIKNKLEANLQIMDVQKLNFPDNSFDAVFSMAAFEFITDIKKAYQQMRRVVKPGGSIIIGTIQKYSSWADLYESPACYGTAYEYAKFKTAQQIIDLDSKRFVKRQDCLFIPPNQPENYYTLINEQKNESKSMKGGFTCLLFQK